MNKNCILILCSLITFYAIANDDKLKTINGKNFVKVSNRIDTSGQPSLNSLHKFTQMGYDLVINLAPPQAHGSIMQEGGLVAQAGASYVNIPVAWNNPTEDNFDFFSHVLNTSTHKKILVHCQINMRGSLFTFLYRVVHEKVDVDTAYEKMSSVWTPSDQWLAFAQMILRKHAIKFTFL